MTAPLPGQPDPYDPTAPLPGSGWTAPPPSAVPPPAGAPPYGYQPAGYPPGGYWPNPYAIPYQPYPAPGPTGPRNGFGTTSLVCGLIGALLGLVYFLFAVTGILGVIALVFGLLGIGRVRRGEATNTAVAVAGTVLGLVACVAAAIGLVVVVHHVSHGVGKVGNYFECVSEIPSNDPQYDAKVQNCLNRFD